MTPPGSPNGARSVRGGFDLHTHSTRSDGTLAPAEVVALAAGAGLAGIALTDHDTLDGLDEAARACAAHGLEFVPGIELSAEAAERSIHLLGYWVTPGHGGLAAECARLRTERDRRARAVLALLAQLGVELDEARVRSIAGAAPIGRPHIAAAMVEAGVAADLDDAFDRFLRDGGPAYEPKRALDPAGAVELIHAAGGVCVLAHPACSAVRPRLLAELVAAGLDGIESDHPSHDPGAVAFWREEARRHGLAATGASDFHGAGKPVKIGERTTDAVVLQDLRTGRPPAAPAGGQRGRTRSW